MASIAASKADSNSHAIPSIISELQAKYGDRVATSLAVREQHGNTVTWVKAEPPDAVVFPHSTQEVSDIVKLCEAHRVPVIAFGTGTSLEGHVNAPLGGICLDLSQMKRVIAVHAEDLDCVIEPGVTRKELNEHLRDQGLFFPIDPGADASIGALRPGANSISTDVCVPISRLAECVEETQRDITDMGLLAPIVGHVGDGNFHCLPLVDTDNMAEVAKVQEFIDRLVARAIAMDGTCTGEHGVGQKKMKYLEPEYGAPAVELMRRLKRAIDPLNIMNPGKIVAV
jgi:FAD/FMN-containing dehydrogenase